MALAIFTQYPDERLDYTIDLTQWLGSDRLVSAMVTADSPLVVTNDHTNKVCTVWVSGGVSGHKYTVSSHFVTAVGREKDFFFQISVL